MTTSCRQRGRQDCPESELIQQRELNIRIEQHLPLVRHIVLQLAVHYPRHVERDELARAGALGLVEAAQRFDDARGVPFDFFASQRIRGAILDAVRAADWAPRSVRALSRRLDSVEQHLASQLGRLPTVDEVAVALQVERSELVRLQARVFRSVVLALEHEARRDGADNEDALVDFLSDPTQLGPDEELERRELHAYLRDALGLLPERLKLVIVGYYLEGRTSAELAAFLGVTVSRISQLRTEALETIREGIEAQYEARTEESTIRGRVAKRKMGYAVAISDASLWRNRLDNKAALAAAS